MPGGGAALLVAAGSGARLGRGRPKALVPLLGEPMLRWSARMLARVPGIERIVVAAPPDASPAEIRGALSGLSVETVLVAGGARRRDSVREGLAALGPSPLVLVHDAARPLATEGLARRVLEAAERVGAAVPAVVVPDTLVRARGERVGEVVDRAGVSAVQTPQGFRADLLARAHDDAPDEWDAPDDGSMVHRAGAPVATVEGEPENFKVTWPGDLARAEAVLAARAGAGGAAADVRVGLGWDVHPLVHGRPFLLLGVDLGAEAGPAGHSDGDPLSHAVADALLGAAALGDIGELFPDDDPACEGIAGSDLLARTVQALAAEGFRPLQVDAVVVTDRPKLAPFRGAVRQRLSELLGVPLDAVSVKGKRTEGLGGLAGGAGVACHAVARVLRTRGAR